MALYQRWKVLYDNEKLEMGAYSYGEPEIATFIGDRSRVRVGKFVSIGPDVVILEGGNHHSEWVSQYPFRSQFALPGRFEDGHPSSKGDVTIGHDSWIGRGARVLSGTTIGNGAVVAAYAVVTKDVAPYTMVAGNPAREVRRRFSDEQISALERIAWWDWPLSEVLANVPHLCSDNIDAFIRRFRPGGPGAVEWTAEPGPLGRGEAAPAPKPTRARQ
jgi:acetyltransferase-like isoleucine patch superfamily enzyme